jgi:hypothetical protein
MGAETPVSAFKLFVYDGVLLMLWSSIQEVLLDVSIEIKKYL